MSAAQDPFSRLTVAIEPWLDHVVIIGGWAHRLYREHPAAQQLDYPPLTTLDTDIAVPLQLPIQEHDIRNRLLAHGFNEEILGDDRPPATHYHLGGEYSGFYAEFLTPLIGGAIDRKGKRRATVEVGGVTSQRLRHIELLLHDPWSINLVSNGINVKVQIANPVSFIVQKILIHDQRDQWDRAKDILYIHDTLEVFAARLDDMRALWGGVVAPRLNLRSQRKVSTAAGVLFGSITDDIRRAARVADARAISPEAIRQACEYGSMQMFG